MGTVAQGICRIRFPMSSETGEVNAYLVQDEGEAILVDAALPDEHSLSLLLDELAAAGLTPFDLREVVLTHAHGDHAGLVSVLRERWKVPVAMHRIEFDYSQIRNGPCPPVLDALIAWLGQHGVPQSVAVKMGEQFVVRGLPYKFTPDRYLSEEEPIRVGRTNWEVYLTPGHSPGHVCLWEQNRRVLISGDHVMPDLIPSVTQLPGGEPDVVKNYLIALDRVAAFPSDLVLPGHGHPFASVNEAARRIQSDYAKRFDEWISLLSDGKERTAYEVATAKRWGRRHRRLQELPAAVQRILLSETVAELDYLHSQRLIDQPTPGI